MLVALITPLLCVLVLGQTLPDPKHPSTVGWLLVAAGAVAVAVNQVTGGVLNFRKLKAGDRLDAARFATRQEHAALASQVGEVKGEVSAMQKTLSTELRSVHRALGRIEGALGTAPARKKED